MTLSKKKQEKLERKASLVRKVAREAAKLKAQQRELKEYADKSI